MGMKDEMADAIITDPPYGIGYSGRRYAPIANDERPYIWWLADAFRVTKMGGGLLCFCRWDVQEAFRWAIELAGYNVRSQVVWDREAHGAGDTKKTFAPQHDVIWFATKGNFSFPGPRPTSVVRSMKVAWQRLVHPNQKPLALMEHPVTSVTPEGGTVVDPFMGSGSTGVAALRTGRRFVGIEIDPKNFRVAEKRLNEAIRTR